MGKKEASKGREWEKGRRNVLNQTFNELYKALPSYDERKTLSKKTILVQALACINQLQEEKKENFQGKCELDLAALQKWLLSILSKFSRLLSFLNSSKIEVPPDYTSLEAPPGSLCPEILRLVAEIESITSNSSDSQINVTNGEQKDSEKKTVNLTSGIILTPSDTSKSSCRKLTSSDSYDGKLSIAHPLKSDFNGSMDTNPSIIQSNPLVVQSSSLQMPSQLLFASSSSSNAPLSSPLPLLVSVTGVKTVNPFILVQSNVMAPNPLSTSSIVCGGGNTRPIQPYPPIKTLKKMKKVPIPSLSKPKNFSSLNSLKRTNRSLKRDSETINTKSSMKIKSDKSNKSNKMLKGKLWTENISAASIVKAPMKSTVNSSTEKQSRAVTASEESTATLLDLDKENIVQCDGTSNVKGDGSQGNPFVNSVPKLIVLPTENLEPAKEVNMMGHSATICTAQSQRRNTDEMNHEAAAAGNNTPFRKRLYVENGTAEAIKLPKCDPKVSITINGQSNSIKNSIGFSEEPSPVKISKTNYSISALCARKQLLQSAESDVPASAQNDSPQEILKEKNPVPQTSKQATDRDMMAIDVPLEASACKPTNSCSLGKGKETDVYSEWADKPRLKSDRVYSSYSVFSNSLFHNSKNTFIPISDMESFKTVPESFDSADTSFSLPLQSNDISNDIFASLQVPTAGHHPESTSPTAAFLLAFPLVSTSKATELLSDDTVCENNDSQPAMKTILQIGNLDCDTPVTKCVSIFENSNVVYSTTSVFSREAQSISTAKTKSLDSTVDHNFMHKDHVEDTQKCNNNGNFLSLKEHSNFVPKDSGFSASLKNRQSFTSKQSYQPPCSSRSKQTCQTTTGSNSTSLVSSHHSVLVNKNEMELSRNDLNKSPNKLNHSQEPATLLVCQKQAEWMEIPQTSHAIFTDYPSSSVPRSDCAVNFALPSVLMSSTAQNEEVPPVTTKSQALSSSSGILSWSTISSTENNQSSKPTTKLAHFQDMFPFKSNKSGELQPLTSNQTISVSSESVSVSRCRSSVNDKVSSAVSNYCGNNHIVDSSGSPYSVSAKQNEPSQNFILSDNSSPAKKNFSGGTKQAVCNSIGVAKDASDTSDILFTQQLTRLDTLRTSSAGNMYPSAENKLSKPNNSYYDERSASQNIKGNMLSTSGNNCKQSSSLLHFNHSNIAAATPELKQIVPNYHHIPDLTVKETVAPHQMAVSNYHHQSNNISKQHVASSNHYSTGITNTLEPKKDMSDFNQNTAPVEISKQNSSSLNFSVENASNMLQFNSTSDNVMVNHQDPCLNKLNSHERQQPKPQQNQQRQQCGRANNKETVTNLHRPPVNWMTAPDIRSHQHHSGPSFGNSSNMNSTQGLLYLPEHTKDSENAAIVFDSSANFHCLEIPHSGQPLFKSNELHLFGNENMENFHDNSTWSPSKNGGSSMLGSMMIPSTLPTLVGDLALGDNNISRPFLPSYNDAQPCPKKSVKRAINSSRRSEKAVEDTTVVPTPAGGQECGGSFLSVSQLVDTGNASKSRISSSSKESGLSYAGSFNDHDTTICQTSKQNATRTVSSNYTTEALLSSSNPHQMNQLSNRKRRSHGTHYSNNYVGSTMTYQNNSTVTLQAQGPQTQFLPDLPRVNDYQGTFLPSDSVPPFMLGNPSRSHRNHSYPLQNIADRQAVEDSSNSLKTHNSAGIMDSAGRQRTSNSNSVNNAPSSTTISSSSNIMDFGYMNMTPTVLQDDMNFTNHPPPHPSFLPHHSYSMPTTQDSLYSTPRLSMHPSHPPQSSNIQSPSATTLTNFHLSTIFPEINEKVIC